MNKVVLLTFLMLCDKMCASQHKISQQLKKEDESYAKCKNARELCRVFSRAKGAFLKGRSYASFSQISSLAKMLGASVSELLAGDMQHYDKTVVDCMNEFQDTKNREMILDLIDNYIDIVDAVSAQ